MTQVAVFSAKPYDQAFLAAAADGHINLSYFDFNLNVESASVAKGYQVVSAFVSDDLNRDTLAILARGGTKLIALRSAGYNNVDLFAARDLDITIVNVPAYSPYAVAEHTIALMLALSRKLPRAYNRIRDGNFSLDGLLGFDFYQKVVGIIGGGKIGQLVGERLKAFGCSVLVADPHNAKQCEALGFESVSEEALFAQSDIITLHCPLVTSTQHIINAETVSKMKKGVMVINTSRGGLVDTRAVLSALKAHHIAYLGIDVYEEEGSLFFEDHSSEIIQDDVLQRLITLPNVMITGHQAYFTEDALQHISEATVMNILNFVNKRPLANQVQAA
ncbi:MAG: D-lactate dehydrogenase [Methylophagaceae bacterium]|jgi:D-lactate dehydrogenase